MKSLYAATGGPFYAFRSPINSPAAVVALRNLGATAPEIVAAMADAFEETLKPRAIRAIRSVDLNGFEPYDPDKSWVKGQLAKRARYIREVIVPSMRASGYLLSEADAERMILAAERAAAA
jgi:hypothetical protein